MAGGWHGLSDSGSRAASSAIRFDTLSVCVLFLNSDSCRTSREENQIACRLLLLLPLPYLYDARSVVCAIRTRNDRIVLFPHAEELLLLVRQQLPLGLPASREASDVSDSALRMLNPRAQRLQ